MKLNLFKQAETCIFSHYIAKFPLPMLNLHVVSYFQITVRPCNKAHALVSYIPVDTIFHELCNLRNYDPKVKHF